ncbi:MAG TPA: glycosyltransferase family A protein, partial [Verrucomicrobiae bacterium]|nr:glycosyltransferase family A protein [Verrucomicrobiae bacterium]
MLSRRYIIIAPVRNEEAHLRETIESVASQTVRPVLWIIVDDGSSDRTAQIADEAARAHGWIKVVHRADRGFRRQGGGVMEAFYDGYKLIGDESWDFLIKLDGDLSFAPDYFEKCLK